MSVQSGRTYEQEFALEIAKAKVRPRRGCSISQLPCSATPACRTTSARTLFQRRGCSTQEGKVKNTPWGSSFRAPQQILHGELLGKQEAHCKPICTISRLS